MYVGMVLVQVGVICKFCGCASNVVATLDPSLAKLGSITAKVLYYNMEESRGGST